MAVSDNRVEALLELLNNFLHIVCSLGHIKQVSTKKNSSFTVSLQL